MVTGAGILAIRLANGLGVEAKRPRLKNEKKEMELYAERAALRKFGWYLITPLLK